MNTEHIVKILQLKGFGRKTAFNFIKLADSNGIETEHELINFILECSAKKLIPRFSDYNLKDINFAFDKGNDILYKSEKSNIKILSYFDIDFPNSLKSIEDPPLVLSFKGDYKSLNNLTGVAIIGTREPTDEGYKAGLYFGQKLGENNFNIVSGLAKGCDSSAHIGCLNGNGFTTAVLAGGLNYIYPKENIELARKISTTGVLMSEYLYGVGSLPNYFIERDRLQAGLSKATIVIQTDIKGGTMHAVNATLKSKKILGAVQYNESLYSEKIRGNNRLISTGEAFALKSSNIDDFIEKIKIANKPFDIDDLIKPPKIENIQLDNKQELNTKKKKSTKSISIKKKEMPDEIQFKLFE